MSGPNRVQGRTAVVTGGGTGLGTTIARHLIDAGARVVLVGRRLGLLESAREQLGPQALVQACDVADAEQVDRLRAATADLDVSIVVNNAGVGGPVAPLVDITPEQWDEVFAINVRGTYLMCRAFLPQLTARGDGDIVNLASVSGKRPLARRTPYTASKMAVIGLTSTLAFEVGDTGVRVNSLSPGPVESERMHRNFTLDAERTGRTYEQAQEEFVSRAALRRMVTADEVGQAVVAMLALTGMTGADVDLSAGMIA